MKKDEGLMSRPISERLVAPTETPSLLPCPFCGAAPISFPSGDGSGTMIECMSADCVNPHVSYYGDGEAARRWNRRVATASPEGGPTGHLEDPKPPSSTVAEGWRPDRDIASVAESALSLRGDSTDAEGH